LAEALAVAVKLPGNTDPNLPIYAAELGEANERLLHYSAAQENFQLAWKVARTLDGEEHANTIETESRLGRFFGDVSRYRESVQHLRHATDVCLRVKGQNDPFYTPKCISNMGKCWA
jgi:hypothetical protein